jgi:ATP/maltotriose-dependent transcriptional regulator MalT
MGQFEEAAKLTRSISDASQRLDLGYLAAIATMYLAEHGYRTGNAEQARKSAERVIAMAREQGDRRWEGYALKVLSALAHDAFDFAHAAEYARMAMAVGNDLVALYAVSEAYLARAQLAQGQLADALVTSRHAHGLAESLGWLEEGDALVRLVYAQCLDASRDRQRARQVIEKAVFALTDQARAITTPAWRASFLSRFAEHVAIFQMARHWGVEVPQIEMVDVDPPQRALVPINGH